MVDCRFAGPESRTSKALVLCPSDRILSFRGGFLRAVKERRHSGPPQKKLWPFKRNVCFCAKLPAFGRIFAQKHISRKRSTPGLSVAVAAPPHDASAAQTRKRKREDRALFKKGHTPKLVARRWAIRGRIFNPASYSGRAYHAFCLACKGKCTRCRAPLQATCRHGKPQTRPGKARLKCGGGLRWN